MFENWSIGLLALMAFGASIDAYFRWDEPTPAILYAVGSLVFAIIAFLRTRALKRKKDLLTAAVRTFEHGLARAFREQFPDDPANSSENL